MIKHHYYIRILFALMALLTIRANVLSQERVRVEYDKGIFRNTFYSLSKDKRVAFTGGYYFPEYEVYSHTLYRGTTIIDEVSGRNSWVRKIENIRFRKDTTALYARFFTSNIKKLVFHFWYNGKCIERIWDIPYDGYQVPFFDHLSDWKEIPDPRPNGISITVIPVEKAISYRLSIGELIIGNYIEQPTRVRHPFFDGLLTAGLKQTARSGQEPVSPDKQTAFIYKSNFNCNYRNIYGTVTLTSNKKDLSEKQLLYRTLSYVLQSYPFYQERHISKDSVRRTFNALIAGFSDTLSFCAMGDTLKNFLSAAFRDPHFGIELSSSQCPVDIPKKTRPGIRLYNIGGDVEVSAIFDPGYEQTIHPGDKVTAIDGTDIRKILESDAYPIKKNSDGQYDVSAILDRNKGATLQLTTIDSADRPAQTVLYTARPYTVRKNFRASDLSVTLDSGKCARIRFPHWDLDVYTRVLNHWDEIKKAKSIILDLRGNGGGETVSAMRLFSLFIDKPTYYYNTPLPASSLIIRNDIRHHYPANRKVVILVDAGTACTSECFTEAMRQQNNVTIIGTSTTYGAVAERYNILFAGGLILYVDCVMQKALFRNGRSIEAAGIPPTIKVKLNAVYDLQPYKDKAMTVALQFVNTETAGQLVNTNTR